MYLIGVIEGELAEQDKFCKSWYFAINDFRERHKVNVQRYEVIANEIEYDFYYNYCNICNNIPQLTCSYLSRITII